MAAYSRILVTGGAGFIGSHLVDHLLKRDYEVTVIDDLSSGRIENIIDQRCKNLRFIKGDIRDFKLVKRIVKDVDAIFHEAALASTDLSVKDPIAVNEINVGGTLNLLKAASESCVKRFIYASSAAVYGNISVRKKKENMTQTPLSPYAVSKLAAENYVWIFHRLYGLETVVLRYFNVYGPRQRFDSEWAYGGVIGIFMTRIFQKLPPIIHGDGNQTRDFVYVQDVVSANMLALNCRKASGEIFNVGTGKRTSINQIAKLLKELIGQENLGSVYSAPRPGDIRDSCADISKARRILRYDPAYSISDGLAQLGLWYSNSARVD
jgi:nucleoside-diphosphate-sugar epimerase